MNETPEPAGGERDDEGDDAADDNDADASDEGEQRCVRAV
jgi:hypothetical protein